MFTNESPITMTKPASNSPMRLMTDPIGLTNWTFKMLWKLTVILFRGAARLIVRSIKRP